MSACTDIVKSTAVAACTTRGRGRGTRAFRTLFIRGAIAVAALAVMVNGARWELTSAPAAANELLMATSVIDTVSGDPSPANGCPATGPNRDQGHSTHVHLRSGGNGSAAR